MALKHQVAAARQAWKEIQEQKDNASISVIAGVSPEAASSKVAQLSAQLSATGEARVQVQEKIKGEQAWLSSKEYKQQASRLSELEKELSVFYLKAEQEAIALFERLESVQTLEKERKALMKRVSPGSSLSSNALITSLEKSLYAFKKYSSYYHHARG